MSHIKVKVVEAKDLKKSDLIGKSDPFVIISVENERAQTKVISNNLNPVWNESFPFSTEHSEKQLKLQGKKNILI